MGGPLGSGKSLCKDTDEMERGTLKEMKPSVLTEACTAHGKETNRRQGPRRALDAMSAYVCVYSETNGNPLEEIIQDRTSSDL